MKKIFLSSIILLLGLFSCNSSSSEYDTFEAYLELRVIVAMHNNLSLQPFDIAYRLNLYLQGENKEVLFPYAEIETDDHQSYTITYTAPETMTQRDYAREGIITVHTYGQDLAQEGTEWNFTIGKNELAVFYPGYGFWSLALDKDEYTVSCLGEKTWGVVANQMYLVFAYPGASPAQWDLDLLITQTQGNSLENARFKIEEGKAKGENPTVRNGGLLSIGTHWRYDITEATLYSTDSPLTAISGGEERLIKLDEWRYPGQDTIIFNFGKSYDFGNNFTVQAKKDSVWTTQTYTWDGVWIR